MKLRREDKSWRINLAEGNNRKMKGIYLKQSQKLASKYHVEE